MSAEPTIQGNPAPKTIGLCPDHGYEFYYPLREGEKPTCPCCTEELILYHRLSPVEEIERSARLHAALDARYHPGEEPRR